MSDLYATSEERDRRGAWLAVAGLVTLLGGLYVAGWLFLGGSVPSGTKVADVDIGGLSPDDAAARLETELADRADQPIRLVWQGHRFQLDPQQAGLRLDVEATVRKAGGGRSWDPTRMVEVLFSTGDVRPVIDVDESALDAALDRLAQQIDRPPVEPRILFSAGGGHTVTQSRSGHALDRRAVADDILAAYLRSDEPVQVRIEAVQPTAGEREIARALDTYAGPVRSGPIRLRVAGRTVDLAVRQFAPALSLRVVDGEFRPAFDVGRLATNTAGLRQQVDARPVNARLILRRERPAVVPARPGRRLNAARVAAAITPALARTGPARTVEVRPSMWEAPFSTADARKLGIRRVVSRFTTRYPHARYRNVNLGRAARLINGTVLRPGETFSFNREVGRPSRANGFTTGYVINGNLIAKDVGGGVSQVATTAFNAAFFAGLEDVQHRPHRIFNNRYPVGREAMVAWPSVDLQFKNTTPYGVMIQSWIDRSKPKRHGRVHVRMWSSKHWDISAGLSKRRHHRPAGKQLDRSRRCSAQPGQPGFDVEVYRYFRRPGAKKVDHKETMRASYLPADRVICRSSRHGGRPVRGR
jgi:vancomycin resistance protein YoaR